MSCVYPESSPFDDDVTLAYYQNVFQELISKSPGRKRFLVACLPSFEPEWALLLHSNTRQPWALTLARADKQIWCAGPELPSVTRQTLDVPPEFAELLISATTSLLRTVSNVEPMPAGLDGISYHFTVTHDYHGRLSGRTHSPPAASAAGRFVGVLHDLVDGIAVNTLNAQQFSSLGAELRRLETLPIYEVDDQTLQKLQKESRKLVAYYKSNVISKLELALQLKSLWRYYGFPDLRRVIGEVNEIPDDVQRMILR